MNNSRKRKASTHLHLLCYLILIWNKYTNNFFCETCVSKRYRTHAHIHNKCPHAISLNTFSPLFTSIYHLLGYVIGIGCNTIHWILYSNRGQKCSYAIKQMLFVVFLLGIENGQREWSCETIYKKIAKSSMHKKRKKKQILIVDSQLEVAVVVAMSFFIVINFLLL